MPTQGFQQVQKQSQSMVLAPQLRQSLKILQVPSLELRSAVLQELQNNPTLEELPYDDVSIEAEQDPSNSDEPNTDEDSEDSDDKDVPLDQETTESSESLDFSEDFSVLDKMGNDWNDYLYENSGEIPYTSEDAERRQHFFDSLTQGNSLQENLMRQARMSEEDEEVLQALEYLVGSLDDNGFVTSNLSDLALMANLPLKKVQEAAKLLKTLDPPGIGADNVQECLLIQLRMQGRGNSLAARIISKDWKMLLRRRIPEIARHFGVSHVEVQNAIQEIAELDPAPGRKFSDDNNQVVEPDVTVYQDEEGEWQIELNNEYIPRLRINNDYKHMMAQGKIKGKEREYLQEKFRSGRFLISAIEQRQQTLERITREILKFQREFFDYGKGNLKPLTMNQVADIVGVHETTVSRAIANKYIRTPHGVFEMKYFFTPGYTGDSGEEISNKSVKDRIAQLIEKEPPSKPLSDQKIVEKLKEEGVSIARRTVAKYREELGILPTNLRRRYE